MVVESAGVKKVIDWDLIQKRFPQISFALTYLFYEPLPFICDANGVLNLQGIRGPLYSDPVEKEVHIWKRSLNLEGIDVLYIYGIGLGYYYKEIQHWLHEKKERKVVFFEEDLSVIATLFQLEIGQEILGDTQVHLYYTPEDTMWPAVIEECVQSWISDRIEWTALPSYVAGREKKLRRLRLELLRRSTSVHAQVGEILHYHKLMKNIATNLLLIPSSFHANQWKGKFKGIPAVICGAGRSLGEGIEEIRSLEQKAIIIAGGSAITALGMYGIQPHIAMALDPNEEEYIRLKTSSCFETPFIYSSRLHKDVLSSTSAQMGYLCSNTGGSFEAWIHDKLGIHEESFACDLGEEALSVTTLAVAFAREMGCSPIILCGVDLSYSDMQRYAPGVVASSSISLEELKHPKRSRDRPIRRKNIEGNFVYTLVKWVMEASCIGNYAQRYRDTEFFNVGSKGLPMKEVASISWNTLLQTRCQKTYDLRGKVQSEIEFAAFSKETKSLLEQSFQDLEKSFKRSSDLIDQMIKEIKKRKNLQEGADSGIMAWIEMEIKEEPAYQICIQQVMAVYHKLLDWWLPIGELDSNQEQETLLEKKERLWNEGRRVCLECLQLFRSF